jgi:enamine deaminase RidA (YjgF/YER057c/UK114 family)
MSAIRKINVPGVGRLPAFCHATVGGNQVFVSGMLGAREGALELVPGGIVAQTTQALRNIQVILAACGCELSNVAKVNVYLTDMASFGEMNKADWRSARRWRWTVSLSVRLRHRRCLTSPDGNWPRPPRAVTG